MKKIVAIFLFCTVLFSSNYGGKELENLSSEHENVNEIHSEQLTTLENTLTILKNILITQQNILAEIVKEADLLYVVLQVEGERINMINAQRVRGLLLK